MQQIADWLKKVGLEQRRWPRGRQLLSAGPFVAGSTHRQRIGKSPCAVEDFGSRKKETHPVVPPLSDCQAIGEFAIAPAELNSKGTIRAFFAVRLFTEYASYWFGCKYPSLL